MTFATYAECLACGGSHEDLPTKVHADGLEYFRCPTTSRELVVDEMGNIRLTGSRSARDFYPTDPSLTRVMIQRWGIPKGSRVLEPCAGDGAIADVLRNHGCVVTTNDIDSRWQCDTTRDFIHPDFQWPEYDLVVTNPPFQVAAEVVRQALRFAPRVIMLLRLNWMEPTGNRRGLVRVMTRGLVFQRCKQTDFSGGGGDSVTVAWFEWVRGRSGPCATDFVYASEIEEAGGQGRLL